MLVLSRKQNESIVIGENVTITVLEIKGNRVRLGIKAPDDVQILRSEIIEVEIKQSSNDTQQLGKTA